MPHQEQILVKAVMKQTKNIQEKKTLKAFLSEHQSEILGDSIKSVDDAMRILDSIDSRNVLATAESQEVFTKMFETFMDSESEVKNSMPTGIRKIFTELADAFRKIYRNVTGKTLMPERIAEAYAGFLTTAHDDANINQILRQPMTEEQSEKILNGINFIFASSDGNYYRFEVKNGEVSKNLPLSSPGLWTTPYP